MKLTGIKVSNVTIKDGKVVKKPKRADVCTELKRRSSKKVKVVKPKIENQL